MINQNPLLLSNAIIKLSKSNMNEAIKLIDMMKEDQNICQETIYQVAKNVYPVNKSLSIMLSNIISHDLKYFTALRAYTYCIDQDEEDLDGMISYMKITYKAGLLDNEKYIEGLTEVVFSIVEYYPSKAKDLLAEIDKIYVTMSED